VEDQSAQNWLRKQVRRNIAETGRFEFFDHRWLPN
jgi:hypothetical protein